MTYLLYVHNRCATREWYEGVLETHARHDVDNVDQVEGTKHCLLFEPLPRPPAP